MNAEQAVDYLVDRLPEFAPVVVEHRRHYDELPFHLLMGDLGRLYMSAALQNAEFTRRYWMAVERVALEADDFVENALGVSVIEWFAWGDQQHSAALRDAWSLLGSKTREIAKSWEADPNRKPSPVRPKRPKRPSKRA